MSKIKYVVKVTMIATEQNPNFAGQEDITYWGKEERMIGHRGSHADACHTRMEFSHLLLDLYGYTRKCDAARNWEVKHPQNDKYWKTTEVTILPVEVMA